MTDPTDEGLKLCEFSSHRVDGDDALLAVESAQIDAQHVATPTPSDSDYMESCLEQQTLLGGGDKKLFRFEKKLSFDGRSFPLRNVATRLDGGFTTSWSPSCFQTVGSVSAIASLPQNLFTIPGSSEDDPIETVVWVFNDNNTLGTTHIDLELSSKATYSNVVFGALIYDGTCILDSSSMLEVEKRMLDIEDLSE